MGNPALSKSWHTPRKGPKENVRPSGPHKQKDRTRYLYDDVPYCDNDPLYTFDYSWIDPDDDRYWDGNQPKHPKP